MNLTPLEELVTWLKRVVSSPRAELTRWQKMVRFGYDLGRYGARQLRRDRAPVIAAALSFRTLFGLLPLLVVGTILVRALGGLEDFTRVLGDFLENLGWADEVEGTAAAANGGGRSLSHFVIDLFEQAQRLNIAAIGWVGVSVLIYSVISLMVTIEGAFNAICRAPEGRPWTRRVPIYWTVITLAPAAIALTVYIDGRFEGIRDEMATWGWGINIAPVLWSFVVTWIVMFVLYKLLPNTRVQAHPAIIGAFVAAVLLEIGKRTMGAYLENAMSISHLYGSLGLIPLFMFWVYIMWLVVLFGLEVAATIQALSGRSLEEIERKADGTGIVDPVAVLAVMGVIGRRFEESHATTARHIADETGLSETTVLTMIAGLVEEGLLHRLDGDDEPVSLARPPERISAAELLEVGYGLVEEGSPGPVPTLLKRLREAQHQLAATADLTELLRAQPVVKPVDQAEAGR
ncbi:MAG: YihY family inner membrane protein [Planctomycetes bacterium]|nr:YihY family inner membrane protein [Planctomycetota bacterium]